MDRMGKALTSAVTSYNQTVGSLEGRVLVSARKLNDLGVTDAELTGPAPVEETARALSAPELVAPELVAPEHEPEPGRAAAELEHRAGLMRSVR
jgi:DNA recombination protein RmuC